MSLPLPLSLVRSDPLFCAFSAILFPFRIVWGHLTTPCASEYPPPCPSQDDLPAHAFTCFPALISWHCTNFILEFNLDSFLHLPVSPVLIPYAPILSLFSALGIPQFTSGVDNETNLPSTSSASSSASQRMSYKDFPLAVTCLNKAVLIFKNALPKAHKALEALKNIEIATANGQIIKSLHDSRSWPLKDHSDLAELESKWKANFAQASQTAQSILLEGRRALAVKAKADAALDSTLHLDSVLRQEGICSPQLDWIYESLVADYKDKIFKVSRAFEFERAATERRDADRQTLNEKAKAQASLNLKDQGSQSVRDLIDDSVSRKIRSILKGFLFLFPSSVFPVPPLQLFVSYFPHLLFPFYVLLIAEY